MGSFGPLPESGLILLVPGRLVKSVQFVLEKSTSRSEGIPFSLVFASFLGLSGCLTLLGRNLGAIVLRLQSFHGSLFIFAIQIRKTFDEFLPDPLEAE